MGRETRIEISDKPDARLRAMAAGIGSEIGYEFLKELVVGLRDAMNADLVLITLGNGLPPSKARTIFALESGNLVENFEYELGETPCKLVYGGQVIVVPEDLTHQFPQEEGLSGYVGVPICRKCGGVVGHLAVFSKAPINEPEAAEHIIRIFGTRVEADMRHQALLEERDMAIADLVCANDTLRERSQALHDANIFKTSLVGMIAHDLRNPLASLVARTELLETRLLRVSFDTRDAMKDIEKIMHASDRMSSLIEATLNRCKAESNRIEVKRQRTNLTSLARVAIETNRLEADRKKISILKPEKEVWARVDEGLLLEAIDNLVSNAIKYSDIGATVGVRVMQTGNDAVVLVKDNGQGLDDLDVKRAFVPFQTLSAKPTAGEKATGLGLSNVQQVAVAHGGKVSVESPGKGLGAVFQLSVPL